MGKGEPRDQGTAARFTTGRIGDMELAVISVALPVDARWSTLSGSEAAVAQAMLRGLSDAEIARSRGTSPRTVARQAQSVYRKLGVSSRRELALMATACNDPEVARG